MPGVDTVKLFCPNCGDIYAPPSSKYSGLDGEWHEPHDNLLKPNLNPSRSNLTTLSLSRISYCTTACPHSHLVSSSTACGFSALVEPVRCPSLGRRSLRADTPRCLFRNHLRPIILPDLPRTTRRAILRVPLDFFHPALWRAGFLPVSVPLAYRRRDVCEP
jgi:hypothetical protein